MFNALKLWLLGPRDSILQHLLEPEAVMFFHRASMLNKIPKIHVKIFKNVVARVSGLNITTPS